ncbi:MAG: hypothetical protein ACYDCL_23530 [Myxococcales bacterium]
MRRRRRFRLRRWLWWSLWLFPAAACSRGEPPDVLRARALLTGQTAQLSAELDGLEARLEDDAARVRFFTELAARHRRVSALACENAGWHERSMARLTARTETRLHEIRRLARADTDPNGGDR